MAEAEVKPEKERVRREWRIPDAMWERIAPLPPPGKPHPLGCHNPRVSDRAAMDAIFFRMRTGCQWNALNTTGICSSSSAHRRFQEWSEAGVFLRLWQIGLAEYDAAKGIDWAWLSMDGAMTKAPQGMCLDKGYDYREVREILKEFGFTAHIRARGEEAWAIKREAGFRARRWVVERTHSWMNRFRAILIRWEKKARNYLALLHLACAYITFKQAGLLG